MIEVLGSIRGAGPIRPGLPQRGLGETGKFPNTTVKTSVVSLVSLALVHLLHQVEENERLEKKNEALEVALSNAKPKAILMDTICGTANELYGLNEAGRILGTSGVVMGEFLDSLGDVYVKRKYTTINRQFLKAFIDRGYGKNVVIGTGRNQAKFTFKGLCFAAVKLIAAGKITVNSIEYEPCREHVERELKGAKSLH